MLSLALVSSCVHTHTLTMQRACVCVCVCLRFPVLALCMPAATARGCTQAALGATYLFAGRQLVTGNPVLGYDLGTVSSLALVGWGAWTEKGGGGQDPSGVRAAQLHGICALPPAACASSGQRRCWRIELGCLSCLPPATRTTRCVCLPTACRAPQVGVAGPRARATQEVSSVAMAALGGACVCVSASHDCLMDMGVARVSLVVPRARSLAHCCWCAPPSRTPHTQTHGTHGTHMCTLTKKQASPA